MLIRNRREMRPSIRPMAAAQLLLFSHFMVYVCMPRDLRRFASTCCPHVPSPIPIPARGGGNLGKDRARDGGEEHINGQTLRGDLGWGDEPLSAGERMLDGVKADFSG